MMNLYILRKMEHGMILIMIYIKQRKGDIKQINPFQVEFAADKYAEKLVQIHQDDYELSWSYLPNTKARRDKKSILNTVQIHDHKGRIFQIRSKQAKVNSFCYLCGYRAKCRFEIYFACQRSKRIYHTK